LGYSESQSVVNRSDCYCYELCPSRISLLLQGEFENGEVIKDSFLSIGEDTRRRRWARFSIQKIAIGESSVVSRAKRWAQKDAPTLPGRSLSPKNRSRDFLPG
jgi:hypothetical protein